MKEMEKMVRRLEKLKVERKNYRVGDKGEEDIREGVEERGFKTDRKKSGDEGEGGKKEEYNDERIGGKGRWKEEEVEKLLEEIGRK